MRLDGVLFVALIDKLLKDNKKFSEANGSGCAEESQSVRTDYSRNFSYMQSCVA